VGWYDEHWLSLVQLAVVVILVDYLLWCLLDASVVVTDVSALEAYIFILSSLNGAVNHGC
jgi:hypothetical protein